MKQKILLGLSAFLFSASSLFAQGLPEYEGGLKVKLNESGEKYFRLITWHQFWLTANENNAGSLKYGEPTTTSVNFGLRRSRFLMFAQLNKKFLIVTHFGLNNQSAFSGGVGADGKKPQVFMHDAWTEYKVFGDKLNLGFGLHYWNGISRLTNASTLNLLTIDAPIFNWATIEKTDQFARKIGIFAHGQLGKFHYRMALSEPFRTNTAGVINTNVAEYSPNNRTKILEGYYSYNFWEKESTLLPYYVGTYLGAKKVLNIGAGFLSNADAMWSTDNLGDTVNHNMLLMGFDAFMELPLSDKGDAITAYAVYYNYDFGPNNVRNIGILNPATGSTTNASLRGNAFPMIGTGDIIYTQVGYILPKGKGMTRYQPYAAFSTAGFEGVIDSDGNNVRVNVFDIGANIFLAGHHAKLTLNYRNRPDFTDVNNVSGKSEFVFQTMIYL